MFARIAKALGLTKSYRSTAYDAAERRPATRDEGPIVRDSRECVYCGRFRPFHDRDCTSPAYRSTAKDLTGGI